MSLIKKFSLEGKTAIVTGGAGLLGRGICFSLAELGADIVLIDCVKEESNAICKEIEDKHSVSTLVLNCDLRSEDSIVSAFKLIKESDFSPDILVNNAQWKGKSLEKFLKPLDQYPMDAWREVMSVNVDSYFLVAREFSNLLRARKHLGSIIQIGSIYGCLAPDPRIYEGSFFNEFEISSPPVYSASKGAVVSLSKYLASYLSPYSIRVNTVSPGGISSGQNKEFEKKYSARVPLARMAKVDDIVGGVVFLASDASSYITGQNIMIDGGLSCW